jgi:thiosulfate/3-mercaptopyruvate sulfurtransferase
VSNFNLAVSPQWLHAHLDDPGILVVDCRFSLSDPSLGQQQYRQAHIPGAYYLDLNRDLSGSVEMHGGRHPLPDPEQFTQTLGAMGIQAQTQVVAYDDSRLAFAARLWWLLRSLGHQQVAVLDGGLAAYEAAGYSLTAEIPSPRPENLLPQPHFQGWVDWSAVQARRALPGVVLVDSREARRYRGEEEPLDPVAGHIPGACNYPWQEATHPDGTLRSSQEQRQRWATLESAEEILVYCGSGVTACVNLLSLELAGIQTGKLYAGSWSDWCSYANLPIATGPGATSGEP